MPVRPLHFWGLTFLALPATFPESYTVLCFFFPLINNDLLPIFWPLCYGCERSLRGSWEFSWWASQKYLSYLMAALQKRESGMQRWLTFARLVIWLMMNVHVSEPERPGCFVCSLFSSVYFLFHQLCVRSHGGAEFYSDGHWEFSHPSVLLMSLLSPYLE